MDVCLHFRYETSGRTYILILQHQSPDEVICPGLLGFLESRRENVLSILDESRHNPKKLHPRCSLHTHCAHTLTHTPVLLWICLLTQEILKGPKLRGSSPNCGKYRSHFFCVERKMSQSEMPDTNRQASCTSGKNYLRGI